jgi:hypothetical protein
MKNQIINYVAFGVLALLWLGFGAALLFNQDILTTVWQSFRSWPLILQLVLGLLVLPATLGLWIWQTPWPVLLRLVLVIGLAGTTLYLFFPRKTSSQMETSQVKS